MIFLTKIKKETALAELAPILSQERRLRVSLADLRRPRPQYHGHACNAERSGAFENWEAWSAQRQIDLNGQLALVLAEKDKLVQSAKFELARHEAVRMLAKSKASRPETW